MFSGYCTNNITNMPGIFLVKNNAANQIAGIHCSNTQIKQ